MYSLESSKLVQDNIVFDLDNYASNYSGHSLIDRLVFCGHICSALRIDAWRLAIQELIKSSGNVYLYQSLVAKLNVELQSVNMPVVDLDVSWISQTSSSGTEKAERLELELNSYKNNMIKESIRMGYNDLGDHYYYLGDLGNALKSYNSARDYLTIPAHIIEMCLNVIRTSIELRDHASVQTAVLKLKQVPGTVEKAISLCVVNVIQGVLDMQNRAFKSAALNFLSISFEETANMWKYVSPRDLAIYGCLCALASFDRSDLKSKVMESSNFKQFLELEPQMREILRAFYHSRFGDCIKILDQLKNEFLLDIFLNSSLEHLLNEIRNRAILQYCIPFLSIDMNEMAKLFSCSIDQIESSVSALIADNHLYARIDSHNKVLRSKGNDQRLKVYAKSLEDGEDYIQSVKYLTVRSKLIEKSIHIV